MENHPLLQLQQVDTQLIQRRHQLSHSAEQLTYQQLHEAGLKLSADLEAVQNELSIARVAEKSHEAEAAILNERIAKLNAQMLAATGDAAKQIAAFEHEIAEAKMRLDEIDGETLELLDKIETLETKETSLRESVTGNHMQTARAQAELDTFMGIVNDQMATLEEDRRLVVANIDSAIIDEYSKLSERLGGVGAAEIAGGACTGCHMKISAPELEDIRRAARDGISHCEQCGRLVVLGD